MGDLLDYAPVAAAAFAIPQFLPQIRKVAPPATPQASPGLGRRSPVVNNAAWLVYFVIARYWTALAAASSAVLLAWRPGHDAGAARRGPQVAGDSHRRLGALLTAAFAVAARNGLGTLLTAAFVLQVTPSIWTACRPDHPTGISQGTWMLILGELSCWAIFGVHKSDPRLIILGFTGVTTSLLLLGRVRRTGGEQSTAPRLGTNRTPR